MNMHNPPHPGIVLNQAHLIPLGLTVTETAKRLKVSRKHLSEIANGNKRITPDLAIRISALTGTSAKLWLNMQASYDLWQLKDLDYQIEQVA